MLTKFLLEYQCGLIPCGAQYLYRYFSPVLIHASLLLIYAYKLHPYVYESDTDVRIYPPVVMAVFVCTFINKVMCMYIHWIFLYTKGSTTRLNILSVVN